MRFFTLFSILFLLFFSACSSHPIPPALEMKKGKKEISYLKDVKPILDKRCVACHSCYNSPCQAKLSSFDGVDRGATKLLVYDATRLRAVDPTRLFIDAQSTEEWREKDFYSLTKSKDSNSTHNDSIMMHLLYDKKKHPEIIGEYSPEKDTLICPRDKKELGKYLDEKPNHGMPYGFPALQIGEYTTLAQWLHQGAKGPSHLEEQAAKKPSKVAKMGIEKWEAFFNRADLKHKMTARYLYEHLYLAHIYFPNTQGEFYELIRSYTPSGEEPRIIPTLRPFDDPKVKKFYYRLRKIHSTIVHKTHMIFKFDDAVLARFNELFIKSKWKQAAYDVGYEVGVSTNPFIAFDQIPVRSRYQFLLDNSHYIIKTFIRGPVCRGQMALNVIHDHFWVMFRDPDYDIAVRHPEFLESQFYNLELPIRGISQSIFKVFSDTYRDKYYRYYQNKIALSLKEFPKGMPMESIWRGEKSTDAPLLTIYRHFDSASVHKGVLGEEPRTMWVIDYAQFERIYYNLVAGYDVYGNVTHQTNIRRYMDFLRAEGELNFLEYMPQKRRLAMFKSWYIGDSKVEDFKSLWVTPFANAISYKTIYPKSEFIEEVVDKHILKTTGISFDYINYMRRGEPKPHMPKYFKTRRDFVEAAKSITLPGSGFITYMTDSGANNIFLRVKMEDGTYLVKNLVINRWHDNVNSLFTEEDTLNASKDTMDILNFSIGSYPNVFVDLQQNELADFLHLMKYMTGTDLEIKKLKKYFVSRSDKNFWKIFDWFQARFYEESPIEAGLYDLNRYARKPWTDE